MKLFLKQLVVVGRLVYIIDVAAILRMAVAASWMASPLLLPRLDCDLILAFRLVLDVRVLELLPVLVLMLMPCWQKAEMLSAVQIRSEFSAPFACLLRDDPPNNVLCETPSSCGSRSLVAAD